MFHLYGLMLPAVVVVALAAGHWQIGIIAAGLEIYSFSWHARAHHSGTFFSRFSVTIFGALIALFGALALRFM